MPKRKSNSLSLPSAKRGGSYWNNFSKSFFGTLENPLGTIISLARGQPPSWSNRAKGIKVFDERQGSIGNLLSSFAWGGIKNMLQGAIDASTRNSGIRNLGNSSNLLAHHLLQVCPPKIQSGFLKNAHNRRFTRVVPMHRGGNALTDILYNLLQNPAVREFGKKAAITTAGILIPKAINYALSHGKKKKSKAARIDESIFY